jgi:hypothetical protein
LIPDRVVVLLRCPACHAHFSLGLMCCDTCGSETCFTWREAPGADVVQRLSCFKCDRRLFRDESQAVPDEYVA